MIIKRLIQHKNIYYRRHYRFLGTSVCEYYNCRFKENDGPVCEICKAINLSRPTHVYYYMRI